MRGANVCHTVDVVHMFVTTEDACSLLALLVGKFLPYTEQKVEDNVAQRKK